MRGEFADLRHAHVRLDGNRLAGRTIKNVDQNPSLSRGNGPLFAVTTMQRLLRSTIGKLPDAAPFDTNTTGGIASHQFRLKHGYFRSGGIVNGFLNPACGEGIVSLGTDVIHVAAMG